MDGVALGKISELPEAAFQRLAKYSGRFDVVFQPDMADFQHLLVLQRPQFDAADEPFAEQNRNV